MRHTLLILALLALAPPVSAQESKDISDYVNFTAATYEDGAGGQLNSPQSIFCDVYANEVIVCSPGNRRIIVYDTMLSVKSNIPHYVIEPRSQRVVPGEPRCAVINRDGDIFVLDNLAEYVDVLNFRGEPFARIYPNRLLQDTTLHLKPDLISIDTAGNLYIMVAGDMQTILVVDQDFKLKRQIGQRGSATNEFNTPVGLAVFDSLVVVTDLYAFPAVKVFDTSGTYLLGFGGHDVARTDLSMASGLSIRQDSTGQIQLWVADALRQVIKVFTDTGEFLSNVGGYGKRIGEYQYPTGLANNRKNTFFVVEKVGGRVQRFDIQ